MQLKRTNTNTVHDKTKLWLLHARSINSHKLIYAICFGWELMFVLYIRVLNIRPANHVYLPFNSSQKFTVLETRWRPIPWVILLMIYCYTFSITPITPLSLHMVVLTQGFHWPGKSGNTLWKKVVRKSQWKSGNFFYFSKKSGKVREPFFKCWLSWK